MGLPLNTGATCVCLAGVKVEYCCCNKTRLCTTIFMKFHHLKYIFKRKKMAETNIRVCDDGRKAVRKYPFDAAHPTCAPTFFQSQESRAFGACSYIAWLRSRPVHSTPDPTMLQCPFVVLLIGFTATALPLDDNFEIANGDIVKDFKDRAKSVNFFSMSLNHFLLKVARLLSKKSWTNAPFSLSTSRWIIWTTLTKRTNWRWTRDL